MLYTKKVLIISLIILLASCKSEPEVYLSNAMDIMKDNSINTKNIDWKSLKSSTLQKAKGKETIEEIYPIIDELILELNDNHSFFIRKQAKLKNIETIQTIPEIEAKLFNKNVAYLKVPAFNQSGDAALEYASNIQKKIKALDRPETKGWVIDLSENSGGNMWPMYLGLAPLIGEGISGYFFDWENNNSEWGFKENAVYNGSKIKLELENSYVLKKEASKIAIITGKRTASSGEAIVIAFKGLPTVKSFGETTAGLSTGNVVYDLSDGAKLVLTTSIMADRNKKLYGNQISPDIISYRPKTEAVEWILQK